MKKTLLVLGLLASASPLFAQEETASARGEIREAREIRKEIFEQRKEIASERKEVEKEIRTELETLRTTTREELTKTTDPEEKAKILEQTKSEREEIRERTVTARTELKQKISSLFSERVTAGLRVYTAHTERAGTIADRITDGVEKLEARGIDATVVKQKVDTALTYVASATAMIATTQADYTRAVESGDEEIIKAAIATTKENFEATKDDIKKAFSELRIAVSEFRKLVKENKTSSAEETTE